MRGLPKFPFIPMFALLLGVAAIVIVLLAGCATTTPGLSRAEFMNRARVFDTEWAGKEYTPEYRRCYPQFFNHLFTECKPIADEIFSDGDGTGSEAPYWECADEALDLFEACLEGDDNVQND